MKNIVKVISSFLLLACQAPEFQSSDSPKEITYYAGNMGKKPWDITSTLYAKGVFYRNVFTQAIYLNEKSELVPGLFLDWSYDKNQKSYTAKVDTSRKYSDGTNIKPEHIEFLYIKIFLTEEDYPIFPFQKNLKGTEKLKKGQKFISGMCECVKAKDDQITFYLKREDPFFLHKLANYFFPISPPDKFSSDLFDFKDLPIGSGAYRVDNYDEEKVLAVLKLREDYARRSEYKRAPETVNFYNFGKVEEIYPDLTYDLLLEKSDRGYRKILGPVPMAIQLIDFNYKNEFGKNQKFREAISLAIDQNEIAEVSDDIKPVDGLILNKDFGVGERPREFNREKAEKIVAKYFSKISSRDKKIRGLYLGSNSAYKPETLKVVERQLSQVGLFVDFTPSSFEDLKRGKDDSVVFWSYGKVLPFYDFLRPFSLYVKQDKNFLTTDPKNEKLVDYYQRAENALTISEKKRLAKELSNIHRENFIQLLLYKKYPAILVSDRINRLEINSPLGIIDFSNVR